MILDSLMFNQLAAPPDIMPPGEAGAILAHHAGWTDKLTRDALAALTAQQFDRRCRHLTFEVRSMLRAGGIDDEALRNATSH